MAEREHSGVQCGLGGGEPWALIHGRVSGRQVACGDDVLISAVLQMFPGLIVGIMHSSLEVASATNWAHPSSLKSEQLQNEAPFQKQWRVSSAEMT